MGRLWSWWSETWRTPRRAQRLYALMGIGFATLAVIAGVTGDAAVALVAGLGALVTVALATFAPRLSRWTRPPDSDSR